ncbi:hypothetical protein [Chitinophaga defluvii]|uniref:Uncharacterized protein n=1 Tax=Chitinophaga defluvii TaxID=3163343 RepID=A0ABV2T444_9BACT
MKWQTLKKQFMLMEKNYKKHLYTRVVVFIFLMMALQACQKGELFEAVTPKIVEVTFTGATSLPLEFVYNNNIIASTVGQNNSFPTPFKMNVSTGDQKIQVREKGKTTILRTYLINTDTFKQHFGILYEEGEIYDEAIDFNLFINPLGKDVEIFLDGKIKDQSLYGGALQSKLTIPLNKEQKRELTVKIKGEKEIILTRTITAADENKTLKFFLDGKKPVQNITLPPLKNPNGMLLTFKLLPDVEFGQTTFLGTDVDFVFYLRDLNTDEVTNLSPEFRVTVPGNQSFVTMELPPLPDSKFYTFDIVKKGTNEVAFKAKDPNQKVSRGFGKYGMFYFMIGELKFILPGEKLIFTLVPYEELGGANFDEIYVTPFIRDYLNDWVDISE